MLLSTVSSRNIYTIWYNYIEVSQDGTEKENIQKREETKTKFSYNENQQHHSNANDGHESWRVVRLLGAACLLMYDSIMFSSYFFVFIFLFINF